MHMYACANPVHVECGPRVAAQVVKALTAAETAYSANPSKGVSDSNLLAGADATLVALVQACLPAPLACFISCTFRQPCQFAVRR